MYGVDGLAGFSRFAKRREEGGEKGGFMDIYLDM